MDFESWALERARRYLGVSSDASADEAEEVAADEVAADPEAVEGEEGSMPPPAAPAASAAPAAPAAPEVEVSIDDESAAAVRDFPSSDATALLIVIVKELVDTGGGPAGDSSLEEDPNTLTKTASSIAHLDEPQATIGDFSGEQVEGESRAAAAEPEGAAAQADAPSEAEAAASAPAAGPEEGGVEVTGNAEDLDRTADTDNGTNILDETNVSAMRESADVLASQTEVSKIIAVHLPLSDIPADDWVAAAYFIKCPDAPEASSFDIRYQVGVLPVASITKLSQVISKAYVPAIQRQASDGASGSNSEVVSTLTKLSASLSSAVTSLK